ncbi:enoyl-CoA hydratase/isomerase family protein [Pelotomaculum propionicicum]|uniref:short-chain-enoyl-CoA hydratase n=1 Tax=Pelotomaculum propionicicum TaxID=258475 RepID=A0A4Y7RLB2_9FIRM|nr:enoyl-CoA hydratase/isomerase family protein [Pelotomaculum propionicicum]TEB09107.1 Short-chain-enoyl-CoA hydratase [Pelotomaculum propionicicum]
MYQKIKFELLDRIALITINNPEQMNTLFPQTFRELSSAVDEIEVDGNVRAVIIWGNEKLFGAGDNVTDEEAIKEQTERGHYEHVKYMQKTFSRIEKLKKPVIAAVAGYCLGGSFELALSCDFIIASENAKFGLPEAKLGVLPCIGGTQRLPRRIGAARAKELMFTCDFVSGQEAFQMGIANHVVPVDNLFNEVMKLARKIADKTAPLAVSMIKNSVDEGIQCDMATGLDIEAKNAAFLFETEDLQEGLAAFMGKRKPVFKGR